MKKLTDFLLQQQPFYDKLVITEMSKASMRATNLNRRIAMEVKKWQFVYYKNPRGKKIPHWHNEGGCYLGIGYDTPIDWAGNAEDALSLIYPREHFTLHTCDRGIRCRIHLSPQDGEATIGDGVADTLSEAICIAVLKANAWRKKKGLYRK